MFENAKKGLGKIYKAEILSIIAVIIGIVSAVIMVALGKAIESEGTTANAVDVVSIISLVVALIIGIVSFFLNLTGVVAASKDDEGFKNAMYIVIVGIVASILASILSSRNPSLANIFNSVNDIAELLVFYYVISGCVSIAKQRGDEALVSKGTKVKNVIMVVWIVSLVLNFCTGYVEGKGGALEGVYVALAIAGGATAIVCYVIYLTILRKTIDII